MLDSVKPAVIVGAPQFKRNPGADDADNAALGHSAEKVQEVSLAALVKQMIALEVSCVELLKEAHQVNGDPEALPSIHLELLECSRRMLQLAGEWYTNVYEYGSLKIAEAPKSSNADIRVVQTMYHLLGHDLAIPKHFGLKAGTRVHQLQMPETIVRGDRRGVWCSSTILFV